MTGPRIDHYDWAGGREAMLRFGPDTGPLLIAALPLFEEANRTRAFVVAICRALAARGIGSVLPDLPGTGESLTHIGETTIVAMRDAYRALAETLGNEGRTYATGIRSGALLDALAVIRARWYLAPQTGDETLRDLSRVRQSGEDAEDYAGNALSPAMLDALRGLHPVTATDDHPARTVRLDTDPRPADFKLAGVPLWRRAEPGNDVALAELLADDIAHWIAACEA